MIIKDRDIKMWSTIGARATVGLAALELAKQIDNLMVLTCDVSTSAGLDRFKKTFPEKYLDLGIAEQNMIGVAISSKKKEKEFQCIRYCWRRRM